MSLLRTWWVYLLAGLVAVVVGMLVWLYTQPVEPETQPVTAETVARPTPATQPPPAMELPASQPTSPRNVAVKPATRNRDPHQSKLNRLTQIRENFTALAKGDPRTALLAAKEITDETERETALWTLLSQWKQGELMPPRQRAQLIAGFGLEAGLGLELANDPELTVLWANTLTEGAGRTALLTHAAARMAETNPSAALGLADQLPQDDRKDFYPTVLAAWARSDPQQAAQYLASLPPGDLRAGTLPGIAASFAQKDTDAAMAWANQLTDANERATALQAIGQVAPVGIGVALQADRTGLVVGSLMDGGPAAQSQQLHPGDRIVAVAQGDNSFVSVSGKSVTDIAQLIRGARGTVVQLQVVPAGSPPNTPPRAIALTRDQIRYKQ